MSFNIGFKWVIAVSFMTIIFGFILILLNQSSLFFSLFNSSINLTFWNIPIIENYTQLFQQWAYGTMGAILVGWGTSLTYISAYPFRNKEPWAWNCLMTSLLLWFITDSAVSLFFKVYINVALNSFLFLAYMIPLLFTRKYFKKKS